MNSTNRALDRAALDVANSFSGLVAWPTVVFALLIFIGIFHLGCDKSDGWDCFKKEGDTLTETRKTGDFLSVKFVKPFDCIWANSAFIVIHAALPNPKVTAAISNKLMSTLGLTMMRYSFIFY